MKMSDKWIVNSVKRGGLAAGLLLITYHLPLTTPVSAADTVITATIVVTNTPADGNVITVNAATKTWKTQPVATPATQIGITNSIGANATNLYTHAATYPWTALQLSRSGTNGIALTGLVNGALAVTLSGTWGSVTYFTNTVTALQVVRVPFSGIPGVTNRTNQASLVAIGLSDYSTYSLPTGSLLMTNFLDRPTAQTITGEKVFATGYISSNTLNRLVAPAAGLSETRLETNATIRAVEGGRFEVSTNAILRFYPGALLQGALPGVTTTNWDFNFTAGSNTVVRRGDFTNMVASHVLQNTNAFAGLIVTNLGARGGTSSGLTITNSTYDGSTFGYTNKHTGDWSYQQSIVTSLATGNNSGLDFGTKTYIKLKAGPAGAFTINGIQAAARDGRYLFIENATGQPWTIAYQSGTDPVAANRIITHTSADVALPTATTVCLIYDIDISRWKLIWFSGAVLGPTSSLSGGLAYFNDTTGRILATPSSSAILDANGRFNLAPANSAATYGVSILSSSTLANNLIFRAAVTGLGNNGFTVTQNASSAMAYTFDGGNVAIGTTGTPIQKVMSTTAVLDFPSTLTLTSSDLNITLTGAADGDVVQLGIPNAAVLANSCWTAWVSAANTITVRFNNYSGGSLNPASGTFRVAITQF